MSRSRYPWFVVGISCFGILIGLLTGLSVSPIASTLIGLLFGFIGGSVVVLIKGRSDDELDAIGRSVTAITLFIVVGLAAGLFLRLGNPFESAPAAFVLDGELKLADIEALGSKPQYAALICQLVKAAPRRDSHALTTQQLGALVDAGVHHSILQAMFDADSPCHADNADDKKAASPALPSGFYIYQAPGAGTGEDFVLPNPGAVNSR